MTTPHLTEQSPSIGPIALANPHVASEEAPVHDALSRFVHGVSLQATAPPLAALPTATVHDLPSHRKLTIS